LISLPRADHHTRPERPSREHRLDAQPVCHLPKAVAEPLVLLADRLSQQSEISSLTIL
jgi:hypothetical protein